ncbi:MAG: phospho-sugar mutase [Ruminococcus sp.]|nr:phospho-sugar mutase [Ruminococcus sp.]MDD7338343.1 phospho-sugar mutase [Ruminococcus sp.]
MNNIKELYSLWLNNTKDEKEIYDELVSVEGKDDEILDRFYKNLEFGTGGLRGVIGAGTNRMNVFTVNQATQGLADYLNAEFDSPSVAIAHDSRINSDVFAKGAAEVLAGNGIKVYFYPELVPTPMLSFAVRHFLCSSGIVITASHNPSQYNGFKCYDPHGYQMTDEGAAKTYGYIQKVDMFTGVKKLAFDEGIKNGMIEYIGNDVYEEFYKAVLGECINPEVSKKSDLKIIYTPLNGTGNKPVRTVLSRMGFKDVTVVPSQENPDGHFPTCPYPNPEIRQAFEEAIKLAEEIGGDLLLATDPDCDRVGIAVNDGGEYKLMTGNEVGVMLSQYLLSCRKEQGTLPKDPAIIKTIVTTNLIEKVAKDYNCKIYNLLTGFKYIGELVTELESKGEADNFVLGMEESYGYLTGIHARDKDAVNGASLVCEMAAYYKEKEGKNLYRVMQDIYKKYGMYLNTLLNFAFAGAEGMDKMKNIMSSLRANPPKEIAGLEVTKVSDYLTGVSTDTKSGVQEKITLPKSNVLAFSLPGGNSAIIRPSGTEPKIKVYVTAVGKDREDAQRLTDEISKCMKGFIGVE